MLTFTFFHDMQACNQTDARTLVVDDDLTPKQQRSLETELATMGGADVKVSECVCVGDNIPINIVHEVCIP